MVFNFSKLHLFSFWWQDWLFCYSIATFITENDFVVLTHLELSHSTEGDFFQPLSYKDNFS